MKSALSTIASLLREQTVPVDRFLQQVEAHRVINPFQYPGDLRGSDPIPGDLWKANGIRRLVLDHVHFGPAPASLPTILSGCSLIEFADWVEADSAPGSWDCFYSQVIKPLNKRDFQFIFHLGDSAKKRFFEVDEVLDIIGDYSSYGHVILMLSNLEADHLWCRLNGRDPMTFVPGFGTPAPGDRYLSLFNAMSIDALVVLGDSSAMHFSREGQFDVGKKTPAGVGATANHRGMFSVGYQLGLLLRLDAPRCTALGLALSGSYPGPMASVPTSALLLEFICNWLSLLYFRTA